MKPVYTSFSFSFLLFFLVSLSLFFTFSFRNLLVFLAPLHGRHKIKSALVTAKIMCVGFTLCAQPYDITIGKTLRGNLEELAVYQNAIRLQRATVMLQPHLTAVPHRVTQTFRAGDLSRAPECINFVPRGTADILARVNRESTCQRNAGRFPRRGSRRGLRLTSINHTRTRIPGFSSAYALYGRMCLRGCMCVYACVV